MEHLSPYFYYLVYRLYQYIFLYVKPLFMYTPIYIKYMLEPHIGLYLCVYTYVCTYRHTHTYIYIHYVLHSIHRVHYNELEQSPLCGLRTQVYIDNTHGSSQVFVSQRSHPTYLLHTYLHTALYIGTHIRDGLGMLCVCIYVYIAIHMLAVQLSVQDTPICVSVYICVHICIYMYVQP